MEKRFAVTTPIYYVNSVPHIGTALTTFVSDVMARYHRMRGRPTFFLTGTDENGTKVMEAAEQAGKEPLQFVDEISGKFRQVWTEMKIEYDDFIRTTEPRHARCVEAFWTRCADAGHIYRDTYEGWYDVSSETFYKESDLVDGKSPDGNEVRWVSEDNWFFRMSAFGERLRAHIEANPQFIVPEVRKNEVLSFIDQGLRDVCISRTNPGWGIPVPGDPDRVVYVWFDALINYVSATGWPEEGWQAIWPAEVQWMAKDILTRFHATLWPAMLMAVGLPLPGTLAGHAFFTAEGHKISKSRGNVVAPYGLAQELAEESGCSLDLAVDAVRHHMAATLPWESDRDYNRADFNQRYNADLANDLGNALNRCLSMAHRFVAGAVPDAGPEPEAVAAVNEATAAYDGAISACRVDLADAAAFELVRKLNKYIDTRAPWALAKAEDPALGAVLYSMLYTLRAVEGLVRPLMPATADAIAAQLGLEPSTGDLRLPAGHPLGQPVPMFPRLDLKKKASTPAEAPAPAPAPKKEKKPKFVRPEQIEITDFMNVHLRVGRVVEAEKVEGSDKLLKLQVMLGEEKRQILAGIAKTYQPVDMIGRQVVVVANLKPALLMGQASQGMLLAADGPDGTAILLQPDSEAPDGSDVH